MAGKHIEDVFLERPKANEKARALLYLDKLISEASNDNRGEDLRELKEIQRLLKDKRYGLVWEEHVELVEEEMKTKIPIFREDVEKKFCDDPNNPNYNFLLEGDNLHSLHLLEKTHKGKIDVIYIDPPYNTGTKEGAFKYNDRLVDKTDSFKHSKWLSFMESRLTIMKQLLSDTGVIFISIDDNEQSHLKILMDDILGEENFIATIVQNKLNAKNDAVNIQKNHEYILVYRSKTIYDGAKVKPNLIKKEVIEKEVFKENNRYYMINDSITTRGEGGTLNARPNLGYTVYYNTLSKDKIAVQDYSLELAKTSNEMSIYKNKSELIDAGYYPIRPPKVRGKLGAWTWSLDKFNDESDNIIITGKPPKFAVKKRTFVKSGDVVEINEKYFFKKLHISNSKSVLDFSTNDGSTALSKIMDGETIFTNPKNVEMIKYLISLFPDSKCTILDFFAGSGTTGQAVIELNAEDGGNRNFILCTNNENKIAEEVTYERMKRVSSGTDKYEAHPMNFKYFKTDFISTKDEFLEESLLSNVRTLVELEHAVDLKNSSLDIALTFQEAERLDLSSLTTVYMRSQVHEMLESHILKKYCDARVKIIDIPERYFTKELKAEGLL